MNKLAIACACAAAICLLALIGLSKQVEPAHKTAGEITAADDGTLVRAVGRVQSVRQSGGNYFLLLCWNKCINAVVFASNAGPMEQGSLDLQGLGTGTVVAVDGLVRVSQGRLEVIASSAHSVEVLGGAGK